MAALRPVEERDGKGNLIRLNPSIVFKSDPQIRKVRGRHDYSLEDNPNYHPPITAQVQGTEIKFFLGEPNSTQARAVAKEIPASRVRELAPYIIEELKKNPIRVREARPTVYEVKMANIDGEEQPVAEEHQLAPGTTELTVQPVAPERYVGDRTEHQG